MSNSYNISDSQFFKKNFDGTLSKTVMINYIGMISEFLSCANENIHIHNTKYYLFVIHRGLETLKHCFKIIYLYTKDADIALFHCKKAFCYYIESMGQIGEDSHTYLQLNSKDATLFVYKKTIFEIDNEYRKKYELNEEEKLFLDLTCTNIDIFGEIIINILYLTEDTVENRGTTIKFALDKSAIISSRLNSRNKNTCKNLKESKIVLFFIRIIKDLVSNSLKYSELCDSFVKKYKKKDIIQDNIYEKLYRNECEEQLNTLTSLRFINWLYS